MRPSIRGAEHAIQDFVFRSYKDHGLALDRFNMDRAAIQRHPGGSQFSKQHSGAPIVVGIHRSAAKVGAALFCKLMLTLCRPDLKRCGLILPSNLRSMVI